jgi:hypothetical protein
MKLSYARVVGEVPVGRLGRHEFTADKYELTLDLALGAIVIGDLASGLTYHADRAGAVWIPEKEAPRGGDNAGAARNPAGQAKKR